jgi:hypothetical protein
MKERISQAFAALREARKGLYEASKKELEAKEYLKRSECGLLLSDKITGKNAEIREAQIIFETGIDRDLLEDASTKKAKAQLAFDLAQLEVDEIKWLIRAEEIKEI